MPVRADGDRRRRREIVGRGSLHTECRPNHEPHVESERIAICDANRGTNLGSVEITQCLTIDEPKREPFDEPKCGTDNVTVRVSVEFAKRLAVRIAKQLEQTMAMLMAWDMTQGMGPVAYGAFVEVDIEVPRSEQKRLRYYPLLPEGCSPQTWERRGAFDRKATARAQRDQSHPEDSPRQGKGSYFTDPESSFIPALDP